MPTTTVNIPLTTLTLGTAGGSSMSMIAETTTAFNTLTVIAISTA